MLAKCSILWEEDIACTDAVATAAMSVMLLMMAGAAAGLMSSRIWFQDKKPRVVWGLPRRIRAHAVICFLALILHRLLRMRLKKVNRKESPTRLLDTLKRIPRSTAK